MKCLILNLLERMKCYKCLFTRSKSEYWLLHSKILQWFYNVKYSKSCLSFIVVPILNYLKIQLLIEALGPLTVILSHFCKHIWLVNSLFFSKTQRYLYYTFHFLFRYTSTCTLQLERVQKVDEIFITAWNMTSIIVLQILI